MRRIILGLASVIVLLVGAGVATAATAHYYIDFTAYGLNPSNVGSVTVHLDLTYDDSAQIGITGGFALTGGGGTVTGGSGGLAQYGGAVTLVPITEPTAENPDNSGDPYPNVINGVNWTTPAMCCLDHDGFFPMGYANIIYPSLHPDVGVAFVGGLMFAAGPDGGNIEIVIAGLANGGYYYADDDFSQNTDPVYFNGYKAETLASEVVPEPGFILFLGIGMGVVSLLAWRIKA
jgi:hypothetical protein